MNENTIFSCIRRAIGMYRFDIIDFFDIPLQFMVELELRNMEREWNDD